MISLKEPTTARGLLSQTHNSFKPGRDNFKSRQHLLLTRVSISGYHSARNTFKMGTPPQADNSSLKRTPLLNRDPPTRDNLSWGGGGISKGHLPHEGTPVGISENTTHVLWVSLKFDCRYYFA